jgi:opacity protein-like surface antigen
MSVKKLLVLAAASVATLGATAAMAGGVDTYSAPVAVTAPTSYFYVQGQVGYAQTDWKEMLGGTNWSKGNGGFTWGADIGYMWTKNLGLELGGFWFPKATNGQDDDGDTIDSIKSWALYGAVKFAVPVYPNMDIYAKAGLGYNRAKWEGTNVGTTTDSEATKHHWGFVGGAGVDYTFDNNVFLNVQYMRFSGKTENLWPETSDVDVWTAGVGYKFAM